MVFSSFLRSSSLLNNFEKNFHSFTGPTLEVTRVVQIRSCQIRARLSLAWIWSEKWVKTSPNDCARPSLSCPTFLRWSLSRKLKIQGPLIVYFRTSQTTTRGILLKNPTMRFLLWQQNLPKSPTKMSFSNRKYFLTKRKSWCRFFTSICHFSSASNVQSWASLTTTKHVRTFTRKKTWEGTRVFIRPNCADLPKPVSVLKRRSVDELTTELKGCIMRTNTKPNFATFTPQKSASVNMATFALLRTL